MALVVKPYDFNSDFERAVVYLSATNTGFFGRLGFRLEAKGFALPASVLVMETALGMYHETGVGPSAPPIVMQRLANMHRAGKLLHDDLLLVQSFFDQYEHSGKAALVSEPAISAELIPILKHRLTDKALFGAIDNKAKGILDTTGLRTELETIDSLGLHDKSVGLELNDALWAAIEQQRLTPRRRTGISELDTQLNGGLVPGALSFFIGGPGDGKSMMLSHVTANCMRQRGLVGVVTLEVNGIDWYSRVLANLTDTPIDVVQGPNNAAVRKALRDQQEAGRLGAALVKDLTGVPTKVQDLKDWVKSCEDKMGRTFDLIVVDYADRMEPHKACKGSYESMLHVYDGLRMWAAEKRLWPLLTASQSKAKGKDQQTLGLYDAADSTHKVRVADLVITINVNRETGEVRYWIAKHRLGKSDLMIGPLPIDFSRGRMAPVPDFLYRETLTAL